jgi:hypothetical protein
MRVGHDRPPVNVPPGSKCCEGILTASAADLPLYQRFLYGTTAWAKSYSRRQAVESVNAALKGKGQFVDLNRGAIRVFGLTKVAIVSPLLSRATTLTESPRSRPSK